MSTFYVTLNDTDADSFLRKLKEEKDVHLTMNSATCFTVCIGGSETAHQLILSRDGWQITTQVEI